MFAWLGKPIDGVFLAALLTVIGYSVNDSVVVFDRIRERLRAPPRAPLAEVANDACLQTVPRTVNTGLGALFILAALAVLGGDTLTDFALALLVGIVVGTWSSVFTATPLLVAFEQRFGSQPATAPRPQARAPVTEDGDDDQEEPGMNTRLEGPTTTDDPVVRGLVIVTAVITIIGVLALIRAATGDGVDLM